MTIHDFKPPANIPIIGQPFTVKNGFATVVIQCGCEAKEPVLLIGGNPGTCKACRRSFVCTGATFNAQSGQMQVQVGLIQPSMPEPVGATS